MLSGIIESIVGRIRFILLLGLIGGPVCLYLGYSESKETKLLETEGKEAAGTVVEAVEKRGRRGRRSYEVVVNFTPENGSAQKKTFSTSEAFASTHSIPGTPVAVRYVASAPETAKLVGEGASKDSSGAFYGIGAVWLVLGVLTLLVKGRSSGETA